MAQPRCPKREAWKQGTILRAYLGERIDHRAARGRTLCLKTVEARAARLAPAAAGARKGTSAARFAANWMAGRTRWRGSSADNGSGFILHTGLSYSWQVVSQISSLLS